MSLKSSTSKMSKSDTDDRSRINIDDSKELIFAKIKIALTDSHDGITYDKAARPALGNLLEIWSAFDSQDRPPARLAAEHAKSSKLQLKGMISDAVWNGLAETRDIYFTLIAPQKHCYLDEIASHGASRAKVLAKAKMTQVHASLGL